MLSALGIAYLVCGIACVAFYFIIGFYSRFGLSVQWIWLAAGAALIACAFLTRAELPRWLRWTWRALLGAGVALVVFLECLVVSGMNAAAPAGLDYLVVLGASVYADGPSPALTRRINAVMNCLDEHPDALIIASGSKGRREPISEAQCIRDELVKRGVDPSRILMEDRSTDTIENIAFSKALLSSPEAKVGIVTNNYHVWRSVRLARLAGLTNSWGIAAEYTGPTLFHYMIREAISISVSFLKGNI